MFEIDYDYEGQQIKGDVFQGNNKMFIILELPLDIFIPTFLEAFIPVVSKDYKEHLKNDNNRN